MKILIAADTYYPNIDGASYFTQRLAKGLADRGHTILVVAPGRELRSGYSTHNGVRMFGVRAVPIFFHKDYKFSLPFFLKSLLRPIVKNFNPDVVHIQGHFFVERAVMRVVQELGIPVIGTNHFMPGNLLPFAHLPASLEEKMKRYMWNDFLSVFRGLPIVTAPTRTATSILKDIGLPQEALPISCGMNLKNFSASHDGSYLKKKYNLPDKPLLLSVCRLATEKNVDWIIKAAAITMKRTPLHVVIAGNGMERGRLEALVDDLGIRNNVTFLGYVTDEDLPYLYPLATTFVMAGTEELQSLVTMEAMASGLPVIAVNALALPELVHHDENGFLFESGDVASLAEYMYRIFSDPALRQKMSEESTRRIQAHDIAKTMVQFEKLYTSLLSLR